MSVSLSPEFAAEKLKEVLSSGTWGTIGQESVLAARELAALLEREAGLVCASPAGAAETVLRALEVSHADEVILPAYCSPFLKEAVEAVGAKPVFASVDELLALDHTHLACCISERTRAVFCEEIGGYPAEIARLKKLCREKDLPLIDVCSLPHAVLYDRRPTVSYADIGLCLLSRGLAALVTDEALLPKLYAAHHCGNPYGTPGGLNTGVCLGGDMRTDEWRPALLRQEIAAADEIARAYNSVKMRLWEALVQDGGIPLDPRENADSSGEYLLFAAAGKESCRARSTPAPWHAYTEEARIRAAGVVFYAANGKEPL